MRVRPNMIFSGPLQRERRDYFGDTLPAALRRGRVLIARAFHGRDARRRVSSLALACYAFIAAL